MDNFGALFARETLLRFFFSSLLCCFDASQYRYIAASWKYVKTLADGRESRTRRTAVNLGAMDGVAVGTVTQEVNGGSWWPVMGKGRSCRRDSHAGGEWWELVAGDG